MILQKIYMTRVLNRYLKTLEELNGKSEGATNILIEKAILYKTRIIELESEISSLKNSIDIDSFRISLEVKYRKNKKSDDDKLIL